MRINVPAFAISCGVVWGLGLLLVTWWIVLLDGASCDPTFIGRVYRGYHLSYAGGLIGLAWALPDGAIGGAIFAWLYNRFAAAFSQRANAAAA
ncbi:MAG: hypothetical protein D6744_14085 [Planctomycetota bacterium]|nr:MAG: hypothetical protein D6744_14085 [Planctomycetota bacterium]